MHNQKRSEYKSRLLDPKISAGLAEKATKWNALSKELLVRRGRLGPDPPSLASGAMMAVGEGPEVSSAAETLKLTEKLLIVNPDPSHLWNHRRELLLLLEAGSSFRIEDELSLTSSCLRRNPKAYGAWFHRKWSIRNWLTAAASSSEDKKDRALALQSLLSSEQHLCAQFLELDERNFHCWNYRRFVVSAITVSTAIRNVESEEDKRAVAEWLDGSWGLLTRCSDASAHAWNDTSMMGPQLTRTSVAATTEKPVLEPEQIESLLTTEWSFTQSKIQKNFSNCSAFHYRSKLLPLMLPFRIRANQDGEDSCNEATTKLELAREELDLVRDAIFTEPDDQTCWWYHRFVISWAEPPKAGLCVTIVRESYLELLEEEAESLRELNDAEENRCKWGLLGLHTILEIISEVNDRDDDNTEVVVAEMNDCLLKLSILDPDRCARYESMKKQ